MTKFAHGGAALLALFTWSGTAEGDPGIAAFSISTPEASPCHATPWVGTDSDPGAVFFSTIEPANRVYRIDGVTGDIKWNVTMGEGLRGIRSSPIGAGALLHIGNDYGTFAALDMETGEIVWSYQNSTNSTCFDPKPHRDPVHPCEVYSSALLVDGVRVQGSEDNRTRAFNATTGELLWAQHATGNVDGTAVEGAPGTNSVWIAADGGFLYNLDLQTGQNVLPPIAHPGTMESIPTTSADRSVLFSMYREDSTTTPKGGVFAVNMSTGSILWNVKCAGGVPLFVADHNAVFVAGTNGTVFAANSSNGQVLWSQPRFTTRFMGPLVFDAKRDLLYGGNFGGEMVAFHASSGEIAWTYTVPTGKTKLIASPLGARISADSSLLYFGSYSGEFHAVHLD